MPPSVNRRRTPPLIAQVSGDLGLANSRAETLRNAGYNVLTFTSQDELALACKSLQFDLLLLGHSYEYQGSDPVCALFRRYKPHSPILQLQLVDGVPSAADYVFNVNKGPEALLRMLEEILNMWARQARAGD